MTQPPKEHVVVQALERAIGSTNVSVAVGDLEVFGRDWTRVHTPNPLCVVFPQTTAEVAEVVKELYALDWPMVPSGGRTGLSAGAVAIRREVVISTSRLRRLGPVDSKGALVRVDAGAVTESVHEHAAGAGLTWPVDFASKGSSQIGGNIATNAGGIRVIRYGMTRNWVSGLVVVTGSGEVVRIGGGLEKNNTGIDLLHSWVSSEGILGVITEATLRLTKHPEEVWVALFALDSLAKVVALFELTRQGPFTIRAFEFFTNECVQRLQIHRKKAPPFGATYSHYVVLEVEHCSWDRFTDWVAGAVEKEAASDASVAESTAQAAEFWALREGISESLSSTGFPHKNDVSLPIKALESFVQKLPEALSEVWPGVEVCLFGHIGDGNVHVNIMKPEHMSKEAFVAATPEADRRVLGLVAEHKGSVSAEHGIGLLKKKWLHLSRSESEIRVMRALKNAFDPKGLFNPGKVLPDSH